MLLVILLQVEGSGLAVKGQVGIKKDVFTVIKGFQLIDFKSLELIFVNGQGQIQFKVVVNIFENRPDIDPELENTQVLAMVKYRLNDPVLGGDYAGHKAADWLPGGIGQGYIGPELRNFIAEFCRTMDPKKGAVIRAYPVHGLEVGVFFF